MPSSNTQTIYYLYKQIVDFDHLKYYLGLCWWLFCYRALFKKLMLATFQIITMEIKMMKLNGEEIIILHKYFWYPLEDHRTPF